jgi:hypothetical protein
MKLWKIHEQMFAVKKLFFKYFAYHYFGEILLLSLTEGCFLKNNAKAVIF